VLRVLLAMLLVLGVMASPVAQALAADATSDAGVGVGETFIASSTEGVPVTYKVLSEDIGANTGTVQVGKPWQAIAQGTAGALTIPAAVTYGGITYTVTSIGDEAFFYCTSLESVTIPDSVVNIGANALNQCEALVSITIGSSVQSIGESAFYGCSSLESVTIPASVESIADFTFADNVVLRTLVFEGSAAPVLGSGVFAGWTAFPAWGTIYYPEGATGYSADVFQAAGLPAGWEIIVGTGEPDLNFYPITIDDAIEDGAITAEPAEAQAGATVTLTVTPDEGYRLINGSLKANGGDIELVATGGESTFTFTMLGTHVTVTAAFVLAASAGVGGAFTVSNADGVPITYKVLTEQGAAGTVQVGDGSGSQYSTTSRAIDASFAGSLTLPDAVAYNGMTYVVTSIGGYAFLGCADLTSVNIPDAVTYVDGYAFRGCSSLASIALPDATEYIGPDSFQNCSSLTSLIIPDNVTRVERGAFRGCTSLATAVFGSSVERIRIDVFNGDRALTTLAFKGELMPALEVSTYHGGADVVFSGLSASGTVYYPEGAVGYSPSVFQAAGLGSGWALVAVTVPVEPESYAITIDGGVTNGTVATDVAEAQAGAIVTLTVTPDEGYQLAEGSLIVNDGTASLDVTAAAAGSGAFTFTMPAAAVTITAAFEEAGGTGLGTGLGVGELLTANSAEGISVTYQVLSEDTDTNTGTVQVGRPWQAIAQDTTGALTIPAAVTYGGITYTVTSIGDEAFLYCLFLESITIPDSVVSIGANAFCQCEALVSINIGSSVQSMGESAFYGCLSLESVTIPASVTSIADYAFSDNAVLRTLIFEGSVAPALGSDVFIGWTAFPASGTVYYPEGATGYDAGTFQAAGLPAGWVFVAVPSGPTEPEVGEPGSGDLDGDGKATASEALQVARAVISGIGDLTPAQIAAVDMDGDGVLTMSDVVRVLRVAAGL
jgi:hypothetical protein